jgi:hypothetical protein
MKVFISYSHVDDTVAQQLSGIGHELGVEYFLDKKDVSWGDRISKKVRSGIETATHLVPVISPASLKSQWVPFEIGYALGRGVHILPFLTHPSLELPGFLHDILYITDLEKVREYLKEQAASTLHQGMSAAEARGRLDQIGITYTQDSFLQRVKRGDLAAVHLFLAARMLPDAVDDAGITALLWAVNRGFIDCAVALVESGASLNAVVHGRCALSEAARCQKLEILSYLLKSGADPNTDDSSEMTPLMWAVAKDDKEAVRALLVSGADVNAAKRDHTALAFAIARDNKDIQQLLLRQGARKDDRHWRESGHSIGSFGGLGEESIFLTLE